MSAPTSRTIAAWFGKIPGAMNGLMAEVLEQHLVTHVLNGATPQDRNDAADELVDVVRSYLK